MGETTSEARQSTLAQRIHDSDLSGGLRTVSKWGFYPDWYWDLVARVDVIVQDTPVQYVTAVLSADGGEVVVLSDTLLVRATVTDVKDFDTDHSTVALVVKAVPLQRVRAVHVDAVSERTVRYDWPARLVVRLQLEHEDVRLPAGGQAWSGPGEQLAAVLPGLLGHN